MGKSASGKLRKLWKKEINRTRLLDVWDGLPLKNMNDGMESLSLQLKAVWSMVILLPLLAIDYNRFPSIHRNLI